MLETAKKRCERLMPPLWAHTKGQAWQPPYPCHPVIILGIKGGFIRRMGDFCEWTDVGRKKLSLVGA